METQSVITAGSTYEELVAFARSHGATEEDFAAFGKSLPRLHEEVSERSAEFSWDEEGKHFVHTRETAAGKIWNSGDEMALYEDHRVLENGKIVPMFSAFSLDFWSIKETVQKGETPIKTFFRGCKEELEIPLTHIDLRRVQTITLPSTLRSRGHGPVPETHVSTAYYNTMSVVKVSWFGLDTRFLSHTFKRQMVRLNVKRDNGTRIVRKWRPYTHIPRPQDKVIIF